MRRVLMLFVTTGVLLAGCATGNKLQAQGRSVDIAWNPAPGFKPAPEQYPMPTPELITKRTDIRKARYPAIDIHFHARDWSAAESQLKLMDEMGVGMIINLDGRFGERLETAMKNAAISDGRLINFARLNWEGVNEAGWDQREADELERSFKAGAQGLKISKRLGMGWKNTDGSYIMPDDARLNKVWAMCAKHGRPIMIHSSDPPARWRPIGPDNERYEAGMWRSGAKGNYYGTDIPNYRQLLDAQERLVANNPKTIFIAAHMACRGWNLVEVARLLETYPNFYVDIDARLQELGRQPYSSRRFIIKYADRVLFGTDGNPRRTEDFWIPHWRFLETDDEYFDHPAQMINELGAGLQGRWKIHGIFLPDDVLKKLYYENALKLLGPKVREDFEQLQK